MRALAVIVFLWMVSPAHAAEMYVSARWFGGTIIHIDGTINFGDEKKFAAFTHYDPATTIVQLDSLGGSVVSAVEIGRMIWARGYTTVLMKQNVCSSACTLIWLSGRHSIIQRYTPLCFHEAFDNRTGQSNEDANSYIMAHLKTVGLTDRQASALVHAAPPSSARCATEWWASQLGFTPQIVTSILGGHRACQAKFCLSMP
jgi:hypothetical protein